MIKDNMNIIAIENIAKQKMAKEILDMMWEIETNRPDDAVSDYLLDKMNEYINKELLFNSDYT